MGKSSTQHLLYNAVHLRLTAFLCGLPGAIYMLSRNYRELGKLSEARAVLIQGLVGCLVFYTGVMFLPDKFPGYVIGIASSGLVSAYFAKYQANDVDESLAMGAAVRGKGAVALTMIGGLLGTLALGFTIWMALNAAGAF